MQTDPNRDIKRKLLLIPLLFSTIIALSVAFGAIGIITLKSQTEGVIPAILLMTAGFIILYSFLISYAMRKNFIHRLDALQKGIFGFLDYLAEKRSDIPYIPEKTGAMSDSINQKMHAIEKAQVADHAFLEELVLVAEAVQQGQYRETISTQPASMPLREVHRQINAMLHSLKKNIGTDLGKVLHALEAYSNEDYRERIDQPSGRIEIAVNHLGDIISRMLASDRSVGSEFYDTAHQVNRKIDTVFHDIDTELQSELCTIVSTVEQVTHHIKENVQSASHIASYAQSVNDAAKEGEHLAQKTADAMGEITQQVETINKAIGIIDKITTQTNILSLNAAVEASTAGEAGKGFAVVAQEVRNLAQQTAKASNEIRSIVNTAKEKAASGNAISDEMITGYHHLVEVVSKTLDMIYAITKSSNEQDAKIQKVHQLVAQMQQMIGGCLTDLSSAQELSGKNRARAKSILEETESKRFATVS